MQEWINEFVSNLDFWLVIGLLGQAAFTSRFLVQWIVSEKQGKSVIPVAFWYLSIIGTTISLIYGIVKAQPFIIFAYSFNNFIYFRNLMLIAKHKSAQT